MMTTPRLPDLPWLLLMAGFLALALRSCAVPPSPPPARIAVEESSAAAWATRVAELERAMADSVGALTRLRRTLAGVEMRRPDRVVVYDTVVSLVRDTVLLSVAVDDRGRMVQDVALPDSGGHRPATYAPILVGDCDGGLRLEAGRVRCDRARLGHLVAWAGAGASAAYVWTGGFPPPIRAHGAAGLTWTPAFRSLWSAEVRVETDGRAVAAVRRGVRLW